MSNKTQDVKSEQKQELDPVAKEALFGPTGYFQSAQNLYNSNPSGMNNNMRLGNQLQMQYLQSPQYQAMVNQLMGQGSGLMNRGVAGNPFTQGRMPSMMGNYQPNFQLQNPNSGYFPQPQAPVQQVATNGNPKVV